MNQMTTNFGISEGPQLRALSIPDCVPLSELDRRYFAFVHSLEFPLNTLALDCQLFTGTGESKSITSLSAIHPLATCLPWLFIDMFSTVSEAEVFDISEAGTLLMMALLLQDHFLDGQLPQHPGIPLLHQRMYTAALQKFHVLFDAQSLFWSYFDKYLRQYTMALLKEHQHAEQIVDYSLETMYEISSGKVALLKTMTTALAIKAEAETCISQLEAAIDALSAALQLGDDTEDWADDYAQRRFTLPLTLVIPNELWPTPNLSVEEISQMFEKSFVLETLVHQVIKWFQKSLEIVNDYTCPCWVEFITNCLYLTRRYQEALVVKKMLKIMASN